MSTLVINGKDYEFAEPVDLYGVLNTLQLKDTGVAIAIDSQVVPRSQWKQPVAAGSEIEILTAVQGG